MLATVPTWPVLPEPITVTVTPENSTATLSVKTIDSVTSTFTTPSSVQYGDFELVRVDVTGQTSGEETATGSVTLTDNGNAIVGPTGTTASVFSLNSEGYLEDQTSFLAVGSHSFVAKYTGTSGSGDLSYNASANSAALPFTVTKCNTTTTITTLPTTIQPGGQVTITVLVDSFTSGNPSGGSSGANMGGTVMFTTPAQSALFRPVGAPSSPNLLAASLAAALAALLLLLFGFPLR